MYKLALDLGTKTCGFAITDEKTLVVSPIENFTYQKNNFSQVVQRVQFWLQEYDNQIDVFVLGYPLNINGTKNPRTLMVEQFAQQLESAFPKQKVVLQDERYSTREAMEQLMQYGLTAAQRQKIKDKMAATIILENWLCQNKHFDV